MSAAKYLPGPWEVAAGDVWATSPWNARVRIASVTQFSPMNGVDSAANARLIAAAPELLGVVDSLLSDIGRDNSMPSAVRARAVLTKLGAAS